jgi:SPP1 family predicted phage head-tail adaptor
VIGQMRERVTLQAPVRLPDGAGGADAAWDAGATVWAKVEERGGEERAAGERLAAEARLRVTIRHRSGVTAEMRALWNGRALEITGIRDPDGRKRFLVLDCEERP